MGNVGSPKPRVSRETRLLFTTVLVSIVALWVLARIRFPDQPPTSNPVSPLLTQLVVRPRFEDLAAVVAEVESRVLPALLALDFDTLSSSGQRSDPAEGVVPALRIRNDVAVTLLEGPTSASSAQPGDDFSVLARDPASGLSVVRVPPAASPVLATWPSQRVQGPRYLVATDVSGQRTSLHPVFVGSLERIVSPTWAEAIWTAPANTGLTAGAFLFTTEGLWVGMAVEHAGGPAVVPAEAVMHGAERLLQEGSKGGGWLGLDAQALTPAVASAAGAKAGVVVTWVDPRSPAAGKLVATDVIETIGGQALATLEEWEAHQARLAPGDDLLLGVRRKGEVQEIQLAAGEPPPAASVPFPLGLTMRAIPRTGAEVIRVDAGSAAARAGIEVGDVVTLAGQAERPTPAAVVRAFRGTPEDGALLVAVVRGHRRQVMALEKR